MACANKYCNSVVITLMMSGVIIFGPIEENPAIAGAGLVFKTVIVG